MLYVFSNNFLKYKNKIYKCSIGKNGIKKAKVEGDYSTPEGVFNLGPLYYRKDRLNNIISKKKAFPIKNNMYWSDNINSPYYNKLINFSDNSTEKLFRKDNIYDLVLVIKYNVNPVIKNKGSAIFLHICRKNYTSTKGCISIEKKDFLEILKDLGKHEKIKIINSQISA